MPTLQQYVDLLEQANDLSIKLDKINTEIAELRYADIEVHLRPEQGNLRISRLSTNETYIREYHLHNDEVVITGMPMELCMYYGVIYRKAKEALISLAKEGGLCTKNS